MNEPETTSTLSPESLQALLESNPELMAVAVRAVNERRAVETEPSSGTAWMELLELYTETVARGWIPMLEGTLTVPETRRGSITVELPMSAFHRIPTLADGYEHFPAHWEDQLKQAVTAWESAQVQANNELARELYTQVSAFIEECGSESDQTTVVAILIRLGRDAQRGSTPRQEG